MKIKLLLLISLFAISLTSGFAQTDSPTKNNKLEFSTGFNWGSLKNLEFAPLSRYDYNGLIYALNYERKSRKSSLFEIHLDYLNTELTSDLIPTLNAGYSKTSLGFSYLKQIYNKSAFAIHLGLQTQTRISLYSKSNYYVAEQEFGITGRFTYQINKKQHLVSKIALPLALLRGTSNSSFDWYSLNRHQGALWNLEYGYALNEYFGIKLNYVFMYNRLQIPNAFREVQYQLNLGLNYKF